MKQKKYLLYAFLLIIGLSNCKKQLDLQPTDTFSENNSFITLEDVQQGVNAAYARYGAYANDMYVSALLSDEAKLGANNAGQGSLSYRYQFASDNTSGQDVIAAWGDYYALIDQVNRVLPKIPNVTATPEEEPRRNILKGQLLGLRAIAHFGLMQAYCKSYNPTEQLGVPVMLVSDPLAKPARNTMIEVMNQIESDLSAAKGLLPAVTAADFSDTVINRINIAAYQARISLYKSDYDKAIAYSTEVISSGIKPLVSGTQFAGIWTDDNNDETLFRIRYANSTTIGGLFTATGGNIYIAPSDKLIQALDVSDIRKTAYIGTDANGNNYVNKFYASSRGGRAVDLKACRTAEMYLIRAESYAKKSSPDVLAGGMDLNTLRANRITGYVDESFFNAYNLKVATIEERYKELAFEGFRFFDLKRCSLPVQRLSSDASAAWQNLEVGSFRFVLPVPNSEILANPNMQQNSGY